VAIRKYILILSGLLIAAALYTRDPFAFTLLYFFLALLLLNRLWLLHAHKHLRITRTFAPYAYPGDHPQIELHLENTSRIPILWVQVFDGLSAEIRPDRSYTFVTTLAGRETRTLTYTLAPTKRGIYQIGPLTLKIGDFLGILPPQKLEQDPHFLIVYPRVLPLGQPQFKSRAPHGSLASKTQHNADPTRITGKRSYHPGDPLRTIDWKATARTNQLQVKQFQPSQALNTAVFLNLNEYDFQPHHRIYDSELAITTAASLLSHLTHLAQSTSLHCFGQDPLTQTIPAPIPLDKGHQHLIHQLSTLATIQRIDLTQNPLLQPIDSDLTEAETPSENSEQSGLQTPLFADFPAYLAHHATQLPWSTALTVITSDNATTLLPALILIGTIPHVQQITHQLSPYHIPVHHIQTEQELSGGLA
jgi:uncharacterized protein (DUF58 family)